MEVEEQEPDGGYELARSGTAVEAGGDGGYESAMGTSAEEPEEQAKAAEWSPLAPREQRAPRRATSLPSASWLARFRS